MKMIASKCSGILFLIVAVMAIVSSCKKDSDTAENCSGKPVITAVSSTVDRMVTTTGGNLSDWIIIQGSNLCGAKKIMFNDVEVNLTTAYITSTEITVAIPRGIPTVVNNKVTIVSDGGEATFGYTVTIPALVVTGMYNEYTPEGAIMTILGKNFDLYELNAKDGKVIFGGAELAIDRSTPDSIFLKVPLQSAVNVKLKLKDKRGIITDIPGQYKDNRGMIYDMSGSFWNSANLTTQDGPVPAPVAGKYAYWNGVYNDNGTSWGWNEQFHIVSGVKLADVGVIGSSNNYLIKFEINSLEDWAKDPFKIKLLGITAEFPLYTNLPFKTNGWKTITIPMNAFKVGGVPVDVTQVMANASTELRLFVHGGDRQVLNVAVDNFRIVPKN